jgi:hypothetical protein
VRWTVAGSIWTALGGGLVAIMVGTHSGGLYVAGKGIAALFAAGFYAGDRTARAVLKGRLRKLARGEVDLSRLKNEADGELLHVRGRVLPREAVAGTGGTVYRRRRVHVGDVPFVEETANDFWLVDENRERVLVQVEGARLIAPEPGKQELPDAVERELALLSLPERVKNGFIARDDRRRRGKRVNALPLWETVVRDGDDIEVVGYKTRIVDSTVERLERETPLRATLRQGKDLPLLIAPVSH